MKRFKSLAKNIALSALSLLVCFGLCELGLKLAGYGNLEVYDWDPYVYWKLRPNQDCYTKINHQPVHINSFGTRGPEFALPKPAGVIRILSLGDSTCFGWGVGNDETYSRLLEKKLNESRKGGARFEVINAGCNAYGYPQLKSYLKHHGVGYQADYVLIGSANLWTDFTEEASPEFKSSMRKRIVLKNLSRRMALYHFIFESQFGGIYHKYRTRFIPVDPTKDKIFTESSTNLTDFFAANLKETIQIAQTNHIKPIVLDFPIDRAGYTNVYFDEILAMRKRVAKDLGIPLIDLDTPDWPPAQKKVYLEGDYVHLNVLGNQIVAEKITQLFTQLIQP